MVRQTNLGNECALCGAPVTIPNDATVQTSITQGAGKPNVRVLSMNGEEFHRCEIPKMAAAVYDSLPTVDTA